MAERFYGKGYDHVDDAAAAALMALNYQPRVGDQEYMGLLVEGPDGKIYRSDFQTQARAHSSEWSGIPLGRPVGIVHNHPKQQIGDRYSSTYFSNQDANTAYALQAPSYIAAIQHNAPSADRKLDAPPHRTAGVKPGNEFLAQFPIDEMLQQQARTNPLTAAYLAQRPGGARPFPDRIPPLAQMPSFNAASPEEARMRVATITNSSRR